MDGRQAMAVMLVSPMRLHGRLDAHTAWTARNRAPGSWLPSTRAPRVGSGVIPALRRPRVMINLIEAAALAACENMPPPGMQTLGTNLNVSHTAATPVGGLVVAVAEVVAVDGREIGFKIRCATISTKSVAARISGWPSRSASSRHASPRRRQRCARSSVAGSGEGVRVGSVSDRADG